MISASTLLVKTMEYVSLTTTMEKLSVIVVLDILAINANIVSRNEISTWTVSNCSKSYVNCESYSYSVVEKCTTALIGASSSNSIAISISGEFKCPTNIDKYNWLGEDTYDYTFSTIQNGDHVTVTRTDENLGWGMKLKFKCCESKFIT